MVKKTKTSKKAKKSSKNNKKSSISRKDFDAFKFGIQRLKELERELNSLDTKGFAREEQVIKEKLKSVSEIPNIEKAIKNLRLKINRKYHPKKRKSAIKEEIHDIKKDIPEIKSDVRSLGRKLEEIEKKKKTETLKKEISEIKEDIPELKKEIRKIDKKIEGAEKKSRLKIDSGVGLLVDTGFTNFLNSLKSSLSARMNTKEKELDEILQEDMEKRQNEFKKKYYEMIEGLNKTYKQKV